MELLQNLKHQLETHQHMTKAEKLELAVQEILNILPPMAQSTCRIFMSSYLQFDQLDEAVIEEGIAELKELLELFEE